MLPIVRKTHLLHHVCRAMSSSSAPPTLVTVPQAKKKYSPNTIGQPTIKKKNANGQTSGSMYKWWSNAEAVNPGQRPLESGADFSFVDGRPQPIATTISQLKHRLDQRRLGKEVLAGLQHIAKCDAIHEQTTAENEAKLKQELEREPMAKGKQMANDLIA